MIDRLYLDHAATTPILPEAQAAVADAMRFWANPSSPHAQGRAARARLEEARARIAAALEWDGAVILTSGASEAAALALGRTKAGPRFVGATEHDAVRRAAGAAASLPVSRLGAVDMSAVAGERPLVAIQSVNSETGVIQSPSPPGLWLADCAQSAGKLPLPDADLIIVSAHKLGGPPGIGALLVRDLALLEASGGQEQGYRGGTENLPGALGFAAALEAPRDWLEDAARWRPMLDAAIIDAGGEVIAASAPRLATIASYRMPGMTSAAQLIRFDLAGIAVSAGSACSSGSLRASPVLAAMGYDEQAAGEVVRVSFGWTTSEADVARFAAEWGKIARSARRSAA
nr:aminotransferase class V-fold PLP-dependent enzyme [Sphingomonas quercus]